ncbi:MAG: 4Fe-4S dicluster domain-containing protein [Chloroflexi bacterium]|nr:4Fe-4S dicluster domain-containing protein [Chloroflexota bacterium]
MALQSFFRDSPPLVLEQQHFQALLDALRARGYRLIGPTVQDDAVVYDDVESVDDFPTGWMDTQSGGTYRLESGGGETLFGYTASPQSWKRYLHPPVLELWKALRTNGTYRVASADPPPRLAFIGVRPCELHAIAIQDKVFLHSEFVDPHYQARRDNVFIVAVNCGQAGGTCFCVSMNTGPKAAAGFDLALTEVVDGDLHYFLVEVGSERGADVMRDLPHRPAGEGEIEAADAILTNTAASMGRELDTNGLKELLYRSYESPRWDEVAARCLTCGNCTQVCPTCFCTTIEDVTDLTGSEATRVRKWDSCFTMDFSYIHGGSIRYSAKSRYRQWMTHKLATWVDQFGSFGCVGCGRCITWCPVGIDITEEAQAIRDGSGAAK